MEPRPPEPSMQLLAEAAQNETRSLENGNEPGSDHDDRSSSLSDLDEHHATEGTDNMDRSSRDSEEEDTEAETERLEDTPQKKHIQKQVLLSGNLSNGGSAIVAEKEAAVDQTIGEEDIGRADPNGHDDEADGAPQTSDMSSLGDSAEASEPEANSTPSSKKRKRESDDDTKQSLKKVALELANHVADQKEGNTHVGSPRRVNMGEMQPTISGVEASDDEGEHSTPEEQPDDQDEPEHAIEQQDAADSNDEDVDMEDTGHEADATSSARSEEEMAKKKAAMDMLGKIEASFAILRDKLFAHKNMQLTEELATMQSESITHPEYLAMVEAIEQLRKDRLKHAKTLYSYKVQALRNRSTANRAQILSQYVQAVRDLRENALEEIGKEWYQIQRGRRRIDEDDNVALNHFGGNRVDHVAHHNAYNMEVSILSGVAKYVGFPAAPPIEGANQTEIEEDLKQMGIPRQLITAPISSAALHFSRPRPAAEEQFLENTPWANPSHPIHMVNNSHRQVSNQAQPSSPFTTPMGQKRLNEAPGGSASTIAALPSSSLAPTPMSVDVGGGVKASNKQKDPVAEPVTETPSKDPGRGGSSLHKRLPLKTSKSDGLPAQKYPQKAHLSSTDFVQAPGQDTVQYPKDISPPCVSMPSQVEPPMAQDDQVEPRFPSQALVPANVEAANS